MNCKIILKQFYTGQKFYSATYFFSFFCKKPPIYEYADIHR